MEARLVKLPDHVEELDDRTGPAVGKDDRKRVWVSRTRVQEVDAEPVDGRPETDPVQ